MTYFEYCRMNFCVLNRYCSGCRARLVLQEGGLVARCIVISYLGVSWMHLTGATGLRSAASLKLDAGMRNAKYSVEILFL